MARKLREAAAAAGDTLPGHEGLVVMIRRWECNRSGISERYRLHYCTAFAIPADRFGDPDAPARAAAAASRSGGQSAAAVPAGVGSLRGVMSAALDQAGGPVRRDRLAFLLGYMSALMTTAPGPAGNGISPAGSDSRSGPSAPQRPSASRNPRPDLRRDSGPKAGTGLAGTVTRPRPAAAAAEAGLPADPMVARLRLGAKLRELRETQAMRLEDAAATLGLAASTLSRIETGKSPPMPRYLAGLLEVYGATDQELRQQLESLASDGQHKPWWTRYNGLLPGSATRYLGLEAAASLVRCYCTQTIPALVQTADYAAAASRAAHPELAAAQINQLVALTRRRQEHFHRATARLHLVLDEMTLLRPIAPAPVIAAQLSHLHALITEHALTVQIITRDTRLPVLSAPFTVLTFPDPADTDLTTTCGPKGQVIINTSPSDVDAATATFTTLAQAALTPDNTAAMINDLTGKLHQPGQQHSPHRTGQRANRAPTRRP